MRYWDASALVPLCVEEEGTAVSRRLARAPIVTWALSIVEITAAIECRRREGALTGPEHTAAKTAVAELAASWTEIASMAAVRERSVRLLATHALRAADALQLAAALVAVSDRPTGHEFVCADRRLREAAAREGFVVVPAD